MVEPFKYELPLNRIAQRPVNPPESARLLVSNCGDAQPFDAWFTDLPDLLPSGALLVFNDSKVIPARLLGTFSTGKALELLLVREHSSEKGAWWCFAKPRRRLKHGETIQFSSNVCGYLLEKPNSAEVLIQFYDGEDQKPLSRERILSAGIMPIPPYIRKGYSDEIDKKDYQSVWAQHAGSVAAPTASLHFSHNLLERLRQADIQFDCLTLHVGPASFLPIEEGRFQSPGEEKLAVSSSSWETIKEVKKAGRPVIAVGTTVARALESCAQQNDPLALDRTDLFITPGFSFSVLDALITNFHQPSTTHLLLVEAFIGRERLDSIYRHALSGSYRFLSYGDGMLLWPR